MPTDKGTDSIPDKGTDNEDRWLTYGELARVRRIDRHSAVKLVTRHGWRRQKDNRGVLRILVPPEWIMSRDKGTDITDRGADAGTDTGPDVATYFEAYRAAMGGQLAALREVIAAKDGEIGALRAVIDQHDSDAIALRRQLHAALAAVEQARREVGAAEMAQADAEADTAELRQAEAARKARGVLSRLRAAWRGG